MKLFKLSELSCLDGFELPVGRETEVLGPALVLALAGPFEVCGRVWLRTLSVGAGERAELALTSCSAFCGEACGVSMTVSLVLVFVGERVDFTKDAHLNEPVRLTGLSASFCPRSVRQSVSQSVSVAGPR